jgi:hypothetical protein
MAAVTTLMAAMQQQGETAIRWLHDGPPATAGRLNAQDHHHLAHLRDPVAALLGAQCDVGVLHPLEHTPGLMAVWLIVRHHIRGL